MLFHKNSVDFVNKLLTFNAHVCVCVGIDFLNNLKDINAVGLVAVLCHGKKHCVICALVGYSDTAAFYKAFKLYTGTTPVKYRKRAK